MNELHACAPGKVMIAGEYSVLFGGACLLAAIDRFAHASYHESDHTEVRLHMNGALYRDDAHPLWLALTKVASDYERTFAPGIYTINTANFFCHDHKLGLGSSAAATVALTKLLFRQHNLDDPAFLHRLSHDAHRHFSQQLGSGADIAASSLATSMRFSYSNEVFSLEPVGLMPLWRELVIIFTGRSQNTRPMVNQALSYGARHPDLLKAFKTNSDRLLDALCTMPKLEQCIALIDELAQLLGSLGERAGIDIVSSEHKAIRHIARVCGGSAKPSGAGGGDLSLALVPKAKRAEFSTAISAAGFSIVSLGLA